MDIEVGDSSQTSKKIRFKTKSLPFLISNLKSELKLNGYFFRNQRIVLIILKKPIIVF